MAAWGSWVAEAALAYFQGGRADSSELEATRQDIHAMRAYINKIPPELRNEAAKTLKKELDQMIDPALSMSALLGLYDNMEVRHLMGGSPLGDFLVEDDREILKYLVENKGYRRPSQTPSREDLVFGLALSQELDKECCAIFERPDRVQAISDDELEDLFAESQDDRTRQEKYLKAIPAELRQRYTNQVILQMDNEEEYFEPLQGTPLSDLMDADPRRLREYIAKNRSKSRVLQDLAENATPTEMFRAVAQTAGIEGECCDFAPYPS